MRTVFLEQRKRDSQLTISGGPGAPIFQPGPQTRIYRAPVRAVAAATLADGTEVWGQILDVSLRGCLLKIDAPLEVGAELEIRITIIGDGRRAIADVRGVVRRSTEEDGRTAYGVELVGDNSQERRVLEWLYAQALR
jgi:hypothetical protein